MQIEVVVEQLDGLFFWRVIGEHARPAVNKHVARQQSPVDLKGFERIGQVMRQTLGAERQ
ncbi:hypothetical protein D3C72_1951240 [compost metagenome]